MLLPNLIRIGPVFGCGPIFAEQVGLLVILEQVALTGRHNFSRVARMPNRSE